MSTEYRITIKELSTSGEDIGTYEEWFFSEFTPNILSVSLSLGVSPANILDIKEI